MFELKVTGFREDEGGHSCALCGRKLSSKARKETHVFVIKEIHHKENKKSKTVFLDPKENWDEDYISIGGYGLIGSHCSKKIPSQFKNTI